jgi:hypothetical protein
MESGMCRGHGAQILWVMVLPMIDRELAITCTNSLKDVDRDVYSFVISRSSLARNDFIFATSFQVEGYYQRNVSLCFRVP